MCFAKTKLVSFHTSDSKPVKQEVNSTSPFRIPCSEYLLVTAPKKFDIRQHPPSHFDTCYFERTRGREFPLFINVDWRPWRGFTKLLTNFFRTSFKLLMNFLQTSSELLMNFFRTSYELLTNFLWTSYKLLKNFLRISYELLTNFLRTSYKLLTNFLQTSYKLLTNFLQTSYKLLTNFLQ